MKFNDFKKLYPLSKTLRFELRPIGKTLEHIERNGLLNEDNHRAESYKKMKKLIDEYHKFFIKTQLSGFKFKQDGLTRFVELYNMKSKSEAEIKEFGKVQDLLRKQIVAELTKSETFKRLNKKELITEELGKYVKNSKSEDEKNECNALIEEFRFFTTYFTEFHKNRQNMYSEEAKSTAIGYRMIHENLPKFIDNINAFKKISSVPELQEKIQQVKNELCGNPNINEISDLFSIEYYSKMLTQEQITLYNMVIGGKTTDNKIKIQGINEHINLYNQKQSDKANRLPRLVPLFKQILSDRESVSWLPEAFADDNDVLDSIKEAYEAFFVDEKEHGFVLATRLKELLSSISSFDQNNIYLANGVQLTDISQKMFGSWGVITYGLETLAKNIVSQKKKESEEDYDERIRKYVKDHKNYSITEVNAAINTAGHKGQVEDYIANLGAKDKDGEQRENLLATVENAHTDAASLLSNEYCGNLKQDEANVAKIKNLLDAIKDLQRFVKPLLGHKLDGEKDDKFYSELQYLWDELDQFTPLYNKVRNYVTQKPYSTEKVKVNFSNSLLLNGWDVNKEKDNTAILLRKDGLYFLAIMHKKHNKVFEKQFEATGNDYDKMEYKLLPGPNKMLPKVFFSKKGLETFKPSKEIIAIKDSESFKKGESFSISDCHKFIDFYKYAIERHPDWRNFKFNFSPTESYEDILGFYREVEAQGYKLTFRSIPENYINTLVEEGKIFLFQIYSKDFSEQSKGTPNMHTIYWKMLFDERNLANVVYKLNGQAEVFFRKASIPPRITHPANVPVKNKNKQNEKKESLFSYDLIKDRRYTVDKFMFHVPIALNFINNGTNNINDLVREYIKQESDMHIIGIDRGERHLLYLSVIDLKGNIKEQHSLNEIINEYNNNTYRTNYHDLLDEKESSRQESRQSWKAIETIKELKEGYLSQVVHKITQLMVKYNAIVVLEDLNSGFMRGRQKVEKQVYQKFEKMLIDKLNYLVDKQALPDEPAGALNALQLTNKVDTLNMIGKQCGFLFYIPAWNTSKIDPATGFTNLFSSDDVKYTSAEKARAFFCKFDSISYNEKSDWFEFTIDYSKFGSRAEGSQQKWTLCTYGPRIKTWRNPAKNSQWDSEEFDLTLAFKQLFADFNIDYSGNLKNAISEQGKEFFDGRDGKAGFCHLFRMMLQMRNSITGSDVDYLISPAIAADGTCFDSRDYDAIDRDVAMPTNADANGAYNIARKGLMAVMQVKAADDLSKFKFDINNKGWLQFAQQKPYLDN